MFLAVIFVVLLILALFGGGYAWRPVGASPEYGPFGAWFLMWICVAILGWVVFGGGYLPPPPR
jgi:hypothetical protein